MDGVRLAILGLYQDADSTILHVQAAGVTPDDDWEYQRGVRPWPSLWIYDSRGRWHVTRMNGYSRTRTTGQCVLYPAIVPPLDPSTAWIDVVAAWPSAEIRARLPLSWA